MRCKVKATGEIVEVEQITRTTAICPANGKTYHKSQLDLSIDNPHPEATISGWVCRDEDGMLCLFSQKPKRGIEDWFGYYVTKLPMDSFPNLTWESDPLEVEITIKPKKR